MSGNIEIEGFEEIEEMLQDMTITPEDEIKAIKAALNPIAKQVEIDTPEKTKKLKKSIVKQAKREGFAVVGIIRYGVFWDIFNEFGSSTNKKHVGFFERAVNKSKNDAFKILAQKLLK